MLLQGKIAFVAGAGGRLGRRVAEVLAREGANVVAADLNLEAAQATAKVVTELGKKAFAVAGDVSSPADVARMVDEAERGLCLPNLLVNAHGVFPNCPMLEVTVEEWDRVFAINVRGTMLTCQTFGNRWVQSGTKGAIVNISSGAATSARIGGAHYCGSKAAVNMLTHAFAIEMGPHGIRVNAVAPGLIMDEVVSTQDSDLHPYVNMMLEATPMGRTGSPNDIAEAVAFLASDRSEWTTGSILEVTGGSHCGRTHVPLTQKLR